MLQYSVYDFNAKGDDMTDDTAAFQNALNFVGIKQSISQSFGFTNITTASVKGGVVVAPAGLYVFKSTISIPAGVTLQGTYTAPPSHPGSATPAFGILLSTQ
jgi:hypothetical protein